MSSFFRSFEENSYSDVEMPSLNGSIDSHLRRVVQRWPGNPALATSEKTITYADFDKQVNQVARCVTRRLGGGRGPVAIMMHAGIPQTAAVFGLYRANVICLRIEPDTPVTRLLAILQQANVVLLLSDFALPSDYLNPLPDLKWIKADEIFATSEDDFPLVEVDDNAPLTLGYTSGTTGAAKIIVQSNRSCLWGFRNYINTTGVTSADRVATLFNRTLDLSGALLCGATACFYDLAGQGLSPLASWLRSYNISFLPVVPVVLRHLLNHMLESGIKHELKVIRSAGEPIHAEDLHCIEQVFGENCILINWIASSETSVAVSYAKCGDTTALAQLGRGKILDELDVKVVDPNNNPLPQGQIGEIVVSSAYLFSGYWNQPQLSRSVLTQHPSKAGFKTFHTGDLGRFDSSGRIEFVSRKDELLKVSGYRVEASEVESSLRKLSGVLDATVTVRPDQKVGSELVAHLEVRDLSILPPVAETRRILEQSLPRYMIPSLFFVLERLPRGPTGKVLRRMLGVLPNARRDRYNVTHTR